MGQLVFPFASASRALAYRRASGTRLHGEILKLLAKHPELSRQELADFLGKGVQSLCQPVLELLQSGQIVETGRTRKTRFDGMASLVALAPTKSKRKRGASDA